MIMNFGKSITLSFILFAVFIGTLVFICMRQEVNLVSADYYSRELSHGKKMDAERNAGALKDQPQLAFLNNQLVVKWNQLSRIEEGELQLLRPSDPDLDRTFHIAKGITDSSVSFPIEKSSSGLYRVRFSWKMEGTEYLVEHALIR